MKFCRLLRYEFTEQIIKNRRYLIVPLFTWFYCLQISGLFYNINPDLHASIGDYLLYIFSGTDPFVKSGQFEYPFFWMALLIISFFVITGFVQKDLHGYGAQMLIRSSTRKKWWASKCVSCILMSAVFVALVILSTAIFCLCSNGRISFILSSEIIEAAANGTYSATQNNLNLDARTTAALLLSIPITIIGAMNMIQLFFSLLIGTIGSFILVNAYMTMVLFVVSPVILPGYLMLNHSSVFIVDGLNYRLGIISGLLLIIAAWLLGNMIFQKADIIEREKFDD